VSRNQAGVVGFPVTAGLTLHLYQEGWAKGFQMKIKGTFRAVDEGPGIGFKDGLGRPLVDGN
jgi:hypothetical protein